MLNNNNKGVLDMVAKRKLTKKLIKQNICLTITLIVLAILTLAALFLALEKHRTAKAYEVRQVEQSQRTKAMLKSIQNMKDAKTYSQKDLSTLGKDGVYVRHLPDLVKDTSFVINNLEDRFEVSAFFNEKVTKDMLDVLIEDGFLVIKVKQKEQKNIQKSELMENYVAVTLVKKMIMLPVASDVSKATIKFENHTLKVVVPKTQDASMLSNKKFTL